MLYIDNSTQELLFPKYLETSGNYELRLKNNTTNQSFVFTGLIDKGSRKFFYVFQKSLDLPVGEYTFSLINNEKVIVTGLLTFGDYSAPKQEYNSNKTYISYK